MDSPDNRSRRGSLSNPISWWTGGAAICGLAAVVLAIFSDNANVLRLAAILGLWAFWCASFAGVLSRRQARTSEMRREEARLTYELELQREVGARREHEVRFTEQVRAAIREEQGTELAELREQVQRLNDTLASLIDGELTFERLTLSAESTRVRSVSESARTRVTSGRAGQKSINSGDAAEHEPAAAAEDDLDEVIDAELVDAELVDAELVVAGASVSSLAGANPEPADSAPVVERPEVDLVKSAPAVDDTDTIPVQRDDADGPTDWPRGHPRSSVTTAPAAWQPPATSSGWAVADEQDPADRVALAEAEAAAAQVRRQAEELAAAEQLAAEQFAAERAVAEAAAAEKLAADRAAAEQAAAEAERVQRERLAVEVAERETAEREAAEREAAEREAAEREVAEREAAEREAAEAEAAERESAAREAAEAAERDAAEAEERDAAEAEERDAAEAAKREAAEAAEREAKEAEERAAAEAAEREAKEGAERAAAEERDAAEREAAEREAAEREAAEREAAEREAAEREAAEREAAEREAAVEEAAGPEVQVPALSPAAAAFTFDYVPNRPRTGLSRAEARRAAEATSTAEDPDQRPESGSGQELPPRPAARVLSVPAFVPPPLPSVGRPSAGRRRAADVPEDTRPEGERPTSFVPGRRARRDEDDLDQSVAALVASEESASEDPGDHTEGLSVSELLATLRGDSQGAPRRRRSAD